MFTFVSFLSLSQWMCQFCTFVNTKPAVVCEMCNLSGKDSSGVSLPQSLQQTPSIAKEPPQPGVKPQPKPRVNLELKRQKAMKEDGLHLIQQIRVGRRWWISWISHNSFFFFTDSSRKMNQMWWRWRMHLLQSSFVCFPKKKRFILQIIFSCNW